MKPWLPLALALLCIALGWLVRGWYDDSREDERVEDAARATAESDRKAADALQEADEVHDAIRESLDRGPAGDRLSPFLECLLNRVEERRPTTGCMPDRVPSTVMSTTTGGDGGRRWAASRVPGGG